MSPERRIEVTLWKIGPSWSPHAPEMFTINLAEYVRLRDPERTFSCLTSAWREYCESLRCHFEGKTADLMRAKKTVKNLETELEKIRVTMKSAEAHYAALKDE